MVAKRAWIPARGTYSIGTTNEPFNPTSGAIKFTPQQPKDIDYVKERAEREDDEKGEDYDQLLENNKHLVEYLKVAALANLAHVHETQNGSWSARGDPTEIALQVFSSRFKWNRLQLATGDNAPWRQIAEFPFDSDVKKMSVIFEEVESKQKHVFTKGAVERIIDSCSALYQGESEEPIEMTDQIRDDILANMESLARLGLRVLALASRTFEGEYTKGQEIERKEIEANITFRGLVGLYDPPRPESQGAVRQCQKAGISVHMLTGDHPGTARAIAREVGIVPSNMQTLSKEVHDAMVMTASQFDKLSEEEIDALPLLPLVIARCAPNTKVRMIEALHRRKCFAAMVSLNSLSNRVSTNTDPP